MEESRRPRRRLPAALLLALAAVVAAAACSSPRTAPSCTGPAFALNEGLWTPTAGADGAGEEAPR